MRSSRRRIEPGPGQESVWDYPRPPAVEAVPDRVQVVFAGRDIVDTDRAVRVLETSHPPVYYVPRDVIDPDVIESGGRTTFCEYKGRASYVTLVAEGRRSVDAGWYYADPSPGYEALRDMVAFYPSRVDACFVGDEQVTAQEGDFYGGWITADVVGPFKGGPGTWGW
jgi:uncharacterized protein (DUF427 family)